MWGIASADPLQGKAKTIQACNQQVQDTHRSSSALVIPVASALRAETPVFVRCTLECPSRAASGACIEPAAQIEVSINVNEQRLQPQEL